MTTVEGTNTMKLSKQTVVKYNFVAIRFEMLFFTILDWKPSDRLPVYFELGLCPLNGTAQILFP